MCWALLASALDKMVMQQARRSPFCVLSSILHPYSQSLARLPSSSRTQSIVCSHASCSLSLARFLPASLTHSVAYLFYAFFNSFLPPSFTNSLGCLLSPSFLPFNSSLDFNLPLSLNHSLTLTFLLLHFLRNISLAHSRFFLFTLACSFSDSLSQ